MRGIFGGSRKLSLRSSEEWTSRQLSFLTRCCCEPVRTREDDEFVRGGGPRGRSGLSAGPRLRRLVLSLAAERQRAGRRGLPRSNKVESVRSKTYFDIVSRTSSGPQSCTAYCGHDCGRNADACAWIFTAVAYRHSRTLHTTENIALSSAWWRRGRGSPSRSATSPPPRRCTSSRCRCRQTLLRAEPLRTGS